MTAVAPAADVDVLNELEQELAIVCEERRSGQPCGQPATCWVVCRQCRAHSAECEEHGASIDAWAAPFWAIGCKVCHAIVRPDRWRDLFDVVPLHLGGA